MYQTVFTRQDIDEGAEIGQTHNLAFIDAVHFDLGSDGFDTTDRFHGRFVGHGGDADGTVIIQLDVGASWKGERLSASVSALYNRINDYILIRSTPAPAQVRNIDASSHGLEAALSYALAPQWTLDASLAHVRGKNRTDGTALAQQPPLEGKLGLNWNNGTWSAGALWRLAARQDRVDIGKGNIAGQVEAIGVSNIISSQTNSTP